MTRSWPDTRRPTNDALLARHAPPLLPAPGMGGGVAAMLAAIPMPETTMLSTLEGEYFKFPSVTRGVLNCELASAQHGWEPMGADVALGATKTWFDEALYATAAGQLQLLRPCEAVRDVLFSLVEDLQVLRMLLLLKLLLLVVLLLLLLFLLLLLLILRSL